MKLSADWMKLDLNIFTNPKIRRIRRMPGGDSIFTLWIFLMCEGMKNSENPGAIEITTGIPCTEDDISDNAQIGIDTVKLGLKVFLDLGMILLENDLILIKNIRDHQSIDKLEYKRELARDRQRKFRAKRQLLIDNASVTRDSVTCNATEQSRAEQSRKEKNKTPPPTVFIAWDTIQETIKIGGDAYKNLHPKIKAAIKLTGGYQQIKMADDFKLNKIKKSFINAYVEIK